MERGKGLVDWREVEVEGVMVVVVGGFSLLQVCPVKFVSGLMAGRGQERLILVPGRV